MKYHPELPSSLKTYDVLIKFCNLPAYRCKVKHINAMQAKDAALEKHRLETGCGTDEMYNAADSTAVFAGKHLWLGDDLYAKPSDNSMGLRTHCASLVGFPSDSASAINLQSQILKEGQAFIKYRGKETHVIYC